MIVLVQYLIIDRQRRRFSKAVAQYVSPAMARRIADESENLDLSPREGEVTCLFSDLAGFTAISERLGPEGTRAVLNPYLQRMSDVLHRHNALINKFMGDGIFAFFNPPILACEAHALAACESALDSRAALDELIQHHAQHPLAAFFRQLAMRIGIASGRVFVGDYGSENKLDYTCVGDTVNLAARLESANKQFGSAIMISQSTRDAAGDRYELRHLGALQVKGQTVTVHVYELLGRRGRVDSAVRAFAEAFNDGVDAFARRDWDTSSQRFEACLDARPADAGARRYLEMIRQYRANPPGDEWQGGLELTEK
jgi:adenylate cyclase